MKTFFTFVCVVLTALLTGLFTGCSYSPVASGTETGNPDIVKCALAMAQQSKNALTTSGKWQPSYYMDSAGNSRIATGLGKQAAASDTLFIPDTVNVIVDTVYYYKSVAALDTTVVFDTLLISDTLSDTVSRAFASDSVKVAQKRVKIDSVFIHDTVATPVTRYVPYRKIEVLIVRTNGDTIVSLQADSLWSSSGYFNDKGISGVASLPVTVGETSYRAAAIRYIAADSLADALSNPTTAEILFVPVNKSVPSGNAPQNDTLFVKVNGNDCMTKTSQLFLSAQKAVDNTVVFRVAYDMQQSILTCMNFFPLSKDTVESLTVAYSLSPGVSASYSGDRLVSLEESILFRLGAMRSMDLFLTPDAAKPVYAGVEPDKGIVTVKAAYTDSLAGTHTVTFEGMVDRTNGFYGVLAYDAVPYTVFVDVNGNVSAEASR